MARYTPDMDNFETGYDAAREMIWDCLQTILDDIPYRPACTRDIETILDDIETSIVDGMRADLDNWTM